MRRMFLSLILSVCFVGGVYGRVTCKDFDTQAEAQRWFDSRKAFWRKLDGDHDGEPCECLYGGSSYEKSFCVKWRKKHGKK